MQTVPPVPPRTDKPPASSDEIAELREEVTELKNQVQVLSGILDEIREELQWVTRNGLPIREALPAVPVLKRMAADPCAEDWSERLVVDRGETPKLCPEKLPLATIVEVKEPPTPLRLPPRDKLFAEHGDQRSLF